MMDLFNPATHDNQTNDRTSGVVERNLIHVHGFVRDGLETFLRSYRAKDVRQNNLDLLRLLFSYAVVYYHCIALSGVGVRPIPLFYSVDTAVQGFFLVSGYLVFSSYERSSTLASYFSKRARRIYPAYFFIILAAALGLYFVSRASSAEYFSVGWLKYVAANLTFLNFLAPILPGVFTDNPMPAVNGSLWTIKVEVAFYLAVPLLAAVMRWGGHLRVLILTYVLSYLYFVVLKSLALKTGHSFYEELAKQLPGQMRYFALGALIHYYDAQIRRYLGFLGPMALLVVCVVDVEDLLFLKPILLACIVFAVAFGPFLINVGRFGDLSYGAYLFHFPIVQLLISFGSFETSPELAIGAVIGLVTLLAYLSWHLLEKPFLAKTSHYVRAEASDKAEALGPRT
ncbi:acyltransferase [Bradyrhizobium sp. SSUT112]|uniref:acyltransferase family protein n=1 Tax=Bradyrhizobium sp. SSUT112 TaxID=3040604 RepID=UPI00244B622F|nr:acyltransferase [Bradyrhizobium sp. SSUT112]MDH2357121.1 acyltransferase [Bradyrhizobium sp. SSUT112]